MKTITKRLIIQGRVQGVGFRYSMVIAAKQFGVTGWVRNRRDGAVEAIVQGTPTTVDQITDWSRLGPPGAAVTGIAIFDDVGNETYTNFTQQPTM